MPAKLIMSSTIEEEWRSERLSPWLRPVLIVMASIFSELGAGRMRIISLLSENGGPGSYGRKAVISTIELPDVKQAKEGNLYKNPAWIATRVNLLFPSPGPKETCTYNGLAIYVEIPPNGFQAEAVPMRDWMQWGDTGRILTPRKAKW